MMSNRSTLQFIEWIKQLDSSLDRKSESYRQNQYGDLVYVDLQETYITDDDLLQLKQMRQLEHLNICANEITDEGLAHLAGLDKIKYLDLGFNPITDNGLVHLRELNALESLVLNGTEDIGELTDRGLLPLSKLENLIHLQLNSAQITDESVKLLKQFKNLRILDIGATLISESGIARIIGSLPNCRVDIEPVA